MQSRRNIVAGVTLGVFACVLGLFAGVQAGEFKPANRVTLLITTKPGSNHDIFSRTLGEAIKQLKPPFTLMMVNKDDGGGAVGNRNVANLRPGSEADNTLLPFNIGDVPTTVDTTNLTMDDFRQLAGVVSEKHIFYTRSDSRFKTFQDFVDALAKEPLVLAGGRGDDIMFFHSVKNGVDKNDNLSSLQTGGTNDTAVQVLGGHVEVGMGKQAILTPFIENGDFRPLAVEGDVRLDPPYQDVPTFTELGYPQIEFIQTRGIFGSKNMSDEAAAYWSSLILEAGKSEYFKKNYIDKFKASANLMDSEKATAAYHKAQEDAYASGFGKKK